MAACSGRGLPRPRPRRRPAARAAGASLGTLAAAVCAVASSWRWLPLGLVAPPRHGWTSRASTPSPPTLRLARRKKAQVAELGPESPPRPPPLDNGVAEPSLVNGAAEEPWQQVQDLVSEWTALFQRIRSVDQEIEAQFRKDNEALQEAKREHAEAERQLKELKEIQAELLQKKAEEEAKHQGGLGLTTLAGGDSAAGGLRIQGPDKPIDSVRLRFNAPNTTRYGLRDEDINDALWKQFRDFHTWMTQKTFQGGDGVIRNETATKILRSVRLGLGWLVYVRMEEGDLDHLLAGAPDAADASEPLTLEGRLRGLRLESLVPGHDAESARLVFELMQYQRNVRRIVPQSELTSADAITKLAKYLYRSEITQSVSFSDGSRRHRKAFDALEVVCQLRELSNDAKARSKTAPATMDITKKWVDWPTYLRCTERLKSEYEAARDVGNVSSEVARRFQTYLIFAILSNVPDRQRTIRELEVGRTFVRQPDGNWTIKHGADDYKTGRAYGERPLLPMDARLAPYLDDFVDRWRQYLGPKTKCLFCQPNGEQLSRTSLYQLFVSTMYRLTGQKTNPHLLRNIAVTHFVGHATTKERTALALLMAHDTKMQRDIYDKRTNEEKIQPALKFLQGLAEHALKYKPPRKKKAKAKKKKKKVAKAKPATPASAYAVWAAEQEAALKEEAGDGGKGWRVLAWKRWRGLPEKEKSPYKERVRAAKAEAEVTKAVSEAASKGASKKRSVKVKKLIEVKTATRLAKEGARPKRPPTAYLLWLAANRPALREEAGSGRVTEVLKLGGQRWRTLPKAEKQPFEAEAAHLKAAYQKEMEEYRQLLATSG